MQKLLQKMRDEDFEEKNEDLKVENEEKLESRFREILEKLNQKKFTFEDLTLNEQKEFATFINDPENIKKHVKEWHPFWKNDEVLKKKKIDQNCLYNGIFKLFFIWMDIRQKIILRK